MRKQISYWWKKIEPIKPFFSVEKTLKQILHNIQNSTFRLRHISKFPNCILKKATLFFILFLHHINSYLFERFLPLKFRYFEKAKKKWPIFTLKSPLLKGGIMSEDIGGFLLLPKNIPKNYLKLS